MFPRAWDPRPRPLQPFSTLLVAQPAYSPAKGEEGPGSQPGPAGLPPTPLLLCLGQFFFRDECQFVALCWKNTPGSPFQPLCMRMEAGWQEAHDLACLLGLLATSAGFRPRTCGLASALSCRGAGAVCPSAGASTPSREESLEPMNTSMLKSELPGVFPSSPILILLYKSTPWTIETLAANPDNLFSQDPCGHRLRAFCSYKPG